MAEAAIPALRLGAMSLLHQESEELDDAARGESFTKGTSHVVWAAIIATVLVSIAVAVYVITGTKPPVAAGEIVQVWAQPRHVVTPGLDANGEAMPVETFDEVLVFAHLKLTNQSKFPLVLENVLANVKLGGGTLSVTSGSMAQYQEVFLAYPELAWLHADAFPPRATLAPGQTLEGNAFWTVRRNKKEWDARKGLDFTFVLQYQPDLVLAPRSAVIEP